MGTKPGTAEPRQAEPESTADEGNPKPSAQKPASRGHGRNGVEAYRGASRIDVAHPSLTAGDPCPACSQGTVYEKTPGVMVRITGQPPLVATVYQLKSCGLTCTPW